MLNMQIEVDIRSTQALFGDQLPRALPYLRAAMLTRLASGGRDAVQKQMSVDFEKPVDWTIRGVRVEGATPTRQDAEVFIPDSDDGLGRLAREYLRPGVLGSSKRRQKRTEYLLSLNGFLPAGWVTTPGTTTKRLGMLNSAGNIPAPIYKQIVNVLQIKKIEYRGARAISARSQARAKKMGVETEWFAVAPGKNKLAKGGGWLPPGVYRRAGRNGEDVQQILKFVRKASYTPRLDFDGTVRSHVEKEAQAAWTAASSAVFRKFNEAK